MYLLLSGEGKSDLGVCGLALDLCDSDNFQPGPMSWIVDQLIEHSQGYEFSHIENNCVSYVSKSYLVTNKPPALQKSMGLPGKKKPIGYLLFFKQERKNRNLDCITTTSLFGQVMDGTMNRNLIGGNGSVPVCSEQLKKCQP